MTWLIYVFVIPIAVFFSIIVIAHMFGAKISRCRREEDVFEKDSSHCTPDASDAGAHFWFDAD